MAPLLLPLLLAATAPSYQSSVEQWRAHRELELRKPDGWLSLAGLFWLKDGPNTAGAAPHSTVALPSSGAPSRAGVFSLHNRRVTFHPTPGVRILVNGKPASTTVVLKSDAGNQTPDIVQAGQILMLVIERGDRIGIRVKDPNAEARRNFHGLRWYPVRPEYRVEASYHRYHPPKTLRIPTVLGLSVDELSPGYAQFRLQGQTLRLDSTIDEGSLFFVFQDRTSGKTTYGAGRFLKAPIPAGDTVVLDFNEAYNPPCAFTPYATCPLPTPSSRLPIAIEAGELNYGDH
jgi:uncharacterized protein (DUF1684 family)